MIGIFADDGGVCATNEKKDANVVPNPEQLF